MAEPDAPMIMLPSDHRPRSIKNKLSTRPNKWFGVELWIAVLDSARPAIWQKPIKVRKKNDRRKLCEKANIAMNIPKPSELKQIELMPTRMRFTDANTKAATVAPTPGADMSRPKPD